MRSELLNLIITAIVVAGALGILFAVVQFSGIAIPSFVWTILLIVLCVVLAVWAVKVLSRISR